MVADWAQDQLCTSVEIHLDWRDRIRVLLGKTVRLMIRTDCEVRPNRVESVTTVHVDHILPIRSNNTGLMARSGIGHQDESSDK